jgi:4'-phosphopantetheinyl transferase EntD
MSQNDPPPWPSSGQFAPPGILLNHRVIAPGDELALLPEELGAFANSVVKVRRASGAARMAARELLARLGHTRCALPKSEMGAPIWPEGIVGSLAHDSDLAVAAVAARDGFCSIGIDIEPAQPLDPDLIELVATEEERRRLDSDPCQGRLLFVVKEAVYKAVFPLDRIFLEHHDVEVDIASRTATTRTGRRVDFRYSLSSHIVALAFVFAADAV